MVTKHLVSVSFFFFFFFANSGLLLTYDIILPTHRCKRYSTVLTGVLWCNRGAGTKERLYPASLPLIRQLSRAHWTLTFFFFFSNRRNYLNCAPLPLEHSLIRVLEFSNSVEWGLPWSGFQCHSFCLPRSLCFFLFGTQFHHSISLWPPCWRRLLDHLLPYYYLVLLCQKELKAYFAANLVAI